MNSDEVLQMLRAYESRNVTFIDPKGGWPIVWDRAKGCSVWDIDGREYLDLTAAFGVAAAGHANPAVVRAGQRQMARLLHAMGDVHPHALKAGLARQLSKVTFERWRGGRSGKRFTGKAIFGNSGFEAVEAALKTAMLFTGKQGLIAFEGGYHGLGYGALEPTHRSHFRAPFRSQLGDFAQFVPFPQKRDDLRGIEKRIRTVLKGREIGAVLVEPVQGRAGIRVPPREFLPMVRQLCDAAGALLIVDEIFTGFGRTGTWFACEHSKTAPDIICLGKALTGGFPLSASVGRADVMDAAWPPTTGEAIHTSTFLGHPVGCAMALAQIEELRRLDLVKRSSLMGKELMPHLRNLRVGKEFRLNIRGAGLMAGLELCTSEGAPASDLALRVVKAMLARGYILLPEGEYGNVISFTPPLTIGLRELIRSVDVLQEVLESVGRQQH